MTAIYVRNQLPTKALAGRQTPHEMWFGKKLLYKNLHVWGSLAYVQIPKETRKRLDKTVQKCIFVGYASLALQYRLYDPGMHRFLISRDVVFNESTSYYLLEGSDNTQAPRYYAIVTQP